MGASQLEDADLDSVWPPSGLEGVKGYLHVVYWRSFISEWLGGMLESGIEQHIQRIAFFSIIFVNEIARQRDS